MRLAGLFFDVPADREAAVVRFWEEALDAESEHSGDPTDPYTILEGGHGAPFPVEVQRLGEGEARIHIDIASEDVDEAAGRLEALGATRVARIESWWVMRDPAGITFCIVPAR